jgi:transposase
MPWSISLFESCIVKAYSQDLRERVIAACQEGKQSHETLARLFKVSSRWIRKLLARQRETGAYAALPSGAGAPLKLTQHHEQRLAETVKKQPDATLAQLRRACGNPPVCLATICTRLQKLGLVRKKKDAARGRTAARRCAGKTGGLAQ